MESLPPRDMENERLLSIIFGLAPTQASVLSCLYRGTGASHDALVEYTGVTESTLKPSISRLRAKLVDRNIEIMSRVGTGYWMEPEECCNVGKIVADYLGGK